VTTLKCSIVKPSKLKDRVLKAAREKEFMHRRILNKIINRLLIRKLGGPEDAANNLTQYYRDEPGTHQRLKVGEL
jgi:hypothetical protein